MSVGQPDIHAQQSQVRDLAALLALQSMWRGRELPYIAATLLDALISLLRLDVVYLRLEDPKGGPPLEDCRPVSDMCIADIAQLLEARRRAPDDAPRIVRHPAVGTLHVVRLFPQLDRESGVVIAASRRPDFPTDVESFLFRTAVEQGMVAIQGSRLLRDLQEANNAKSAFLATMSHELRTPLNAILGYVDLLDAEVAGALNTQQKQSLGRVKSGAHHLMELIEGILAFARVEAGKEEIHRTTVDLVELSKDTAALIEPLARARNLTFTVHMPARPLPMNTDASKIRQILLNLLSNAVKFTSSGTVHLELSEELQDVVYVVSDTGIGIPNGELESVFEPFRQIGDVYTKTNPGTGLGLSVSRHLARLLGGEISVTSELGVGSTFTVRLPRQPGTS